MVDIDQQKCQCRKPLLPVDDELFPILITDDDGTKEVVTIGFGGGALVPLLVALQEFVGEIVDQLGNLLCLPLMFPLIVIHLYFAPLRSARTFLALPRISFIVSLVDLILRALGHLTPAVLGRRPDEAFPVQQHPQAGGGHVHGLVRLRSSG